MTNQHRSRKASFRPRRVFRDSAILAGLFAILAHGYFGPTNPTPLLTPHPQRVPRTTLQLAEDGLHSHGWAASGVSVTPSSTELEGFVTDARDGRTEVTARKDLAPSITPSPASRYEPADALPPSIGSPQEGMFGASFGALPGVPLNGTAMPLFSILLGAVVGSVLTLAATLVRDLVRSQRANVDKAYADFCSAAAVQRFGSDDPRAAGAASLARIAIYGNDRVVATLAKFVESGGEIEEHAEELVEVVKAMREHSRKFRKAKADVGILITGKPGRKRISP